MFLSRDNLIAQSQRKSGWVFCCTSNTPAYPIRPGVRSTSNILVHPHLGINDYQVRPFWEMGKA